MAIKEVRIHGRMVHTAKAILSGSHSTVVVKARPEPGHIEDVFIEIAEGDVLSIGHEADGTLTLYYGGFAHEIRDGALWTRSTVRPLTAKAKRMQARARKAPVYRGE